MNFKLWNNITGWLVFAVAMTVYYFSVEDTGSLWDCGEFIAGAYKLQVVHPPGAPLFLLIGRLFIMIGQLFSDKVETIAFSINILSAVCTALGATFICWVTVLMGKMALVGREGELNLGQSIAAFGGGIVAGLSTAFISSNWFSAVEGEVYAMSTFFTCLTIWTIVKWYHLPNTPKNDRWLILAIYVSALSIGVHLLSLLTFPALALFYYFKKYEKHDFLGVMVASLSGVALVVGMQKIIVTGIPSFWGSLELFLVNSIGLQPLLYSTILLVLILGAIVFYGLRYAAAKKNAILQSILVAFALSAIGYSVVGVVVIRANANPPINMNQPSDPLRLLPYLNREQYGSRPLLRGPNFDARPSGSSVEERYGRVEDHYEVVSQKVEYEFENKDKVLFPRMGDYQPGRDQQYRTWMSHKGKASTFDNVKFFFQYQLGWMYWRYFMWNFVGRQNGEQGYLPQDKTNGHWMSGIESFDESHLYNQSELTTVMLEDQARNKYYFLPLIFGLLGFFYQAIKRQNEFLGLLGLFVITGIGIIVYTNQTPQEPRERDYVLVASFFTFCIWIGMAVIALYDLLSRKINGSIVAPIAFATIMSAPVIMGMENFDDHSRKGHTGARDYASNFLNSVAKDAIIFTYGDNDTYPLWYAQEVEKIRTDVRVVNLSLIAVDWYIEQLRRKVNDSAPIKLSIPTASYRGNRRDQTPVYGNATTQEIDLRSVVKFVGEKHPIGGGGMQFESYLPTTKFNLPVDIEKFRAMGAISPQDTGVVSVLQFNIGTAESIIKDDLAILDLIASNINERPIYFAVTCQPEKLQGLQDYMQLEGLALRIVPIKTKGDPQFSIIGSGRVATDMTYKNITEKFKWGNFDKKDMYVDRSYQPSVQSMRFVMLRSGIELVKEGKKEQAVALADKYFEGFPNMNFPYDYNSFYIINNVYISAGAYDKAKPHVQILVKNVLENLKFFKSIGDKVQDGFEQDYSINLRTMKDVIDAVKRSGDAAYAAELEKAFEPYDIVKDMRQLEKMQK